MLCCVMIINFAISRYNESEKSLEDSIQAREVAEIALMKKNEELEKANQELDRFVYSASHDMRAPLSSLFGLMEIARLTNKGEELNEYFMLMKKRILTMEVFIKGITDYSRNSRTEVEVEETRLIDLVNEVLTTIGFLA
ncbi:MAG TPA: histidine kinase dimerization/phospho-acceptor domain-containing protein [Cyclobacteriaceae bacterium]